MLDVNLLDRFKCFNVIENRNAVFDPFIENNIHIHTYFVYRLLFALRIMQFAADSAVLM